MVFIEYPKQGIILLVGYYHNPNLGLATKTRGCKVVGQEGSMGVVPHGKFRDSKMPFGCRPRGKPHSKGEGGGFP